MVLLADDILRLMNSFSYRAACGGGFQNPGENGGRENLSPDLSDRMR